MIVLCSSRMFIHVNSCRWKSFEMPLSSKRKNDTYLSDIRVSKDIPSRKVGASAVVFLNLL